MITAAGIYYDMASNDYLADPCPQPSLTQSIAKLILRSPKHAFNAHPRLNPNFEPDEDKKFDKANVAHRLMLGRGKDYALCEFKDWRTKAAQEARELTIAAGKVAILPHQLDAAQLMVMEVKNQCPLFGDDGRSEICLAWQEPSSVQPTMWCRQLLDWASANFSIVADYKTTDESADPNYIAGKIVRDGWHIQAAFAERGLDILHAPSTGKREYYFLCQETYAPYAWSITQLRESHLVLGRKAVDIAMTRWWRCLGAGVWPGYPREAVSPEIPAWYESQLLEMEERHGEEV